MAGFIPFCSSVSTPDVLLMNHMTSKHLIKILNLHDVLIINFLSPVIDLEILLDTF